MRKDIPVNSYINNYLMIANRDEEPNYSLPPLSTPAFSEDRRTPKIPGYLYYFLTILGVICIAVVFGGIIGIILRQIDWLSF